ncbi:MAG: acetyl-CoA hydrolase/transferase family protein [Gammaproteobacteria bacterium]|nr:acetyl-CoA hydrolase/transferase family protein [Gammaproteobacteria bacterium]
MRSLTGAGVAAMLRPGMRVFVGGSSNEPRGLVDALAAACHDAPEAAAGVTFLQFPLPGINRFDFSTLHETARMETFFLTPDLQQSHAAGRVRFVPMHLRHVFDFLRAQPPDLAFVQVARDRDGELRLGPNADFHAAASSASTVIAEYNTGIVAPAGAPAVAESSLYGAVETSRPLPEMAPPRLDETARAIGAHVGALVRDGDCLQTGIGAIPAAILDALGNHNDLGLHGGLLDDGGKALVEAGVVTGARKATHTGKHVAGMLLGSQELHDWAATRPDVILAGADVTHDTRVIASLDNFVSVNSAVEVDLHGQVNAEVIGSRQISGVGGAVDFMRAARMSPGGRSIVAMTATARRGTQSRIVPRTAIVTALRTDVDIVVTEFGIAHLHGLPAQARAAALIAIAHPDFRGELQEAATAST